MKKIVFHFSFFVFHFSFFIFHLTAQVVFQKSIGGNSSDIGVNIIMPSDNEYLIIGGTSSLGGNRIYVLNIDDSGNLNKKVYVGSGGENGYNIIQTVNNDYLIAGTTTLSGQGSSDMIICNINNSFDNVLWCKTFGTQFGDFITGITQATNKKYYMTGGTSSLINGFFYSYLISINSNGTSLFSKSFTDSNYITSFRDLQQISDNSLIIIGEKSVIAGSDSSYVLMLKVDTLGNLLWSKRFVGFVNIGGNEIIKVGENELAILAGYADLQGNGGIALISTDTSGNINWTKTYTDTDYVQVTAMDLCYDGGYIITGNISVGGNDNTMNLYDVF